MSQANVEVVHRIYEALSRNDLAAAFPLMTADVEFANPPYAVEPGTHTGHEAFAGAFENLWQTFPTFEYSVDSVEEHGQQVLIWATFRGHRREGDETTWPRFHAWTFRDGKVCRFRWFNEDRELREAAQSEHDSRAGFSE
jgi:ketosteroid isomerase-like protein